MACGVFIASGTSHSGAHVPFEPVITAPASSTPDGPHTPELPFNVRLPTAEYGGGTASAQLLDEAGAPLLDKAGAPLLDEGAAVGALLVVRV
jgi:hypothetical protein